MPGQFTDPPFPARCPGSIRSSSAGLLVPPGDSRALRMALQSLADQPSLLRRLSGESLERARHLTVGAMTDQYETVFRTALQTTRGIRAVDVVPAGWPGPADMLRECSAVVGVSRSSLSHVPRTSGRTSAEIWVGSADPFHGVAPGARLVADLGRPILHSPELPWDRRLPPLIRRPGATSSILLPVHWTRRGTSVVELWTTEEDRLVLGRAELSKVLRLVLPQQSRAA